MRENRRSLLRILVIINIAPHHPSNPTLCLTSSPKPNVELLRTGSLAKLMSICFQRVQINQNTNRKNLSFALERYIKVKYTEVVLALIGRDSRHSSTPRRSPGVCLIKRQSILDDNGDLIGTDNFVGATVIALRCFANPSS